MDYVSFQALEYLSIARRVISVPFKKMETEKGRFSSQGRSGFQSSKDVIGDPVLGRRDRITDYFLLFIYSAIKSIRVIFQSKRRRDVILNRNGTELRKKE